MFKKKYKWMKNICLAMFVLAAAFLFHMDTEAAYIEDKANGVRYDDEMYLGVGYAYSFAQGGGTYCYVNLYNDGDRIANVKSSSKNLLAKKTKERYNVHRSKSYDYNQETGDFNEDITKEEYEYPTAYISCFAKKAGNYTVTFDVIKPDGSVRCTKTIKVTTYATTGENPIKSLKYAGKEIFNYYPYTNKTSGKISVKANKNYKIQKIEIGKYDAKGEIVYKTTKNNKTIKLATQAKYERKTSSYVEKHNKMFPTTYIKISYQNKKTKHEGTVTYALYTMNLK